MTIALLEQDHDGGKLDEALVVGQELVVAGGDAAKLLELVEEASSDVDDASQVSDLLDQAGPIASFTADGAYDQDSVYGEVTRRSPEAAVIVPPRSSAVLSDTAGTAPRSATATCRRSPSTTADAGRRPQAITGALWSRPTSAGSNV